jgi:hypothetical protein
MISQLEAHWQRARGTREIPGELNLVTANYKLRDLRGKEEHVSGNPSSSMLFMCAGNLDELGKLIDGSSSSSELEA